MMHALMMHTSIFIFLERISLLFHRPSQLLPKHHTHACLPTLLLALVRDIVKVSSRGAAFGVLETVVAVGNVVAHAVFGYLAQQGLHPIKLLVGLAVIGVGLFMRLVYIPTPPDARLSLSSENLMRLGGSPGRLPVV